VNGNGPYDYSNSPFIIAEGDEVMVVDRVSVQSDDPVTYTLVEDYPGLLSFDHAVFDFGMVTAGSNVITWSVNSGISNTVYALTKTFVVQRGYGWIDVMTETLEVVDGGTPETRFVEFEIPALVSKDGPVEPMSGNVVSYTIVIETPDPMEPLLRMDRMPHIWCPGCGIGTTVTAFVSALEKLEFDLNKVVVVSGIG
jgi:hypothetical protein